MRVYIKGSYIIYRKKIFKPKVNLLYRFGSEFVFILTEFKAIVMYRCKYAAVGFIIQIVNEMLIYNV